uniref:sodium/calcium exchanger NCL2-like n=1 Tax=Erigeron canadensis TaxID=72917 RepID=UPI001CB8C8EE|nr:sodium/calcium exchanger NCL2-like [Erigeron canadensis]
MSKMASFQHIGFTFIMLMIIGMVKGRWLDQVDTYPTSSHISDGINDINTNYENSSNLRMTTTTSNSSVSTTTLRGEKRCHSIYGFLPCADTMQEGVFLMLMYTYLMMLGEEWIHKGSQALFVLLGDKAIGASVFRVFMALPRIVIVIVSGVLSTASAAQNQVAFGVSMYAGSTVITLTLIWGFRIILSRDRLRGKGSTPELEHQDDLSAKCLPLRHKLSILNDTGVNIDKETGNIAVIMLLSLIPFAVVELVALMVTHVTVLFALVVSAMSLLAYFAYQIWNPWIQNRSLAYLKQENLQTRFVYHVQRLAEDELIDEHGNPKFEPFESIFVRADTDNDDCISHEELEHLILKVFELEKDHISIEYAKAEILTHFDDDKSGKINRTEFKKGCTKWLGKWKNDANSSGSLTKTLWKQVEKVAIKNKRANLTQIEKIMPRILKQVLEQHQLVREDGTPDREKIEGLFSQYDKDSDNEIHQGELREFIETLRFGVALDHDTVLDEVIKEFDENKSSKIDKKEFVEGFIRWIEKAINYDPTIKDPKNAIAKFEEDSWREIDAPMQMGKPKLASVLYVISGVAITYIISGAFIQSVIQFSDAAHIPFLFTSFVMAPIAMNARMVITSLLNVGPRVSKNASLTFSEIYSGLVMNNLLGLLTLLTTVYIKGLTWTYSDEVLAIMIPCAIVGLFAFWRDTYPMWASISAMLLYPISVYIYCALD